MTNAGVRTVESANCEIELFEDDEHEGAVREYRKYDQEGFVCVVVLCDGHARSQQEDLGFDLRGVLPVSDRDIVEGTW